MKALLATVALATFLPAGVALAAPPTATVHIRDDKFFPASLTVQAGEVVTFVNDDDDAHTATADDNSWDSEGLTQGQRWSHRFAKAGRVTYHCTVHPFMHGAVVVKSAQ